MTTPLKEGQAAPDFSLTDGDGKVHRLKDYKGKKVLLYFYPRDSTPGCTTEACNFAGSQASYVKHGVVVLGVSTNNAASHAKFAAKHNLNFPLLADTEGEVSRAYGVLKSLAPLVKVARRVTFLIDERSKIIKIWDPVSAKIHNDEVLAYLSQK